MTHLIFPEAHDITSQFIRHFYPKSEETPVSEQRENQRSVLSAKCLCRECRKMSPHRDRPPSVSGCSQCSPTESPGGRTERPQAGGAGAALRGRRRPPGEEDSCPAHPCRVPRLRVPAEPTHSPRCPLPPFSTKENIRVRQTGHSSRATSSH